PAITIVGSIGLVAAFVIWRLTPRTDGRKIASEPARPETKNDVAQDHVAQDRVARDDVTRNDVAEDDVAHDAPAYTVLLTVAVLDSAGRMGFLLFLPFLLTEKGASLQTIGLAMTMIFAGGAAGKLACTFIGAR